MPKLTNHKFTWSELRGIALVLLGLSAAGYYFSWWFIDDRWQNPWLWLIFVIMLLYTLTQVLGNWLVYLATHHRRATYQEPGDSLTVDVFVTACGEDVSLIERTVTAAREMRYPHTTYLLDDGDDPELAKMATRLGVQYLTRIGSTHKKAGNINAALPRTNGDIIVVFDIDHTPRPEFLERSLSYFRNPTVGFVQVMLTFGADDEWVARAAADTSLDFYNPTSIGSDGLRSTTLIGSNALIRREALVSIRGYQPGLAEDLATSIALHGAGWQSVYVPEPLAPGIAPPDLAAWFTQQLKWARGVFDLLLTVYPRLFTRLTQGQRVSYGLRMTYYWIGSVVAIHIGLAAVALLSGQTNALLVFESYLSHLAPLGIITLMIRQLALRRWRHSSLRGSVQWQPVVLVLATWPVYTLAWLMAVLRIPLDFQPTPKTPEGRVARWWLLPQTISTIMLTAGLIMTIVSVGLKPYPLTYLATLFFIVMQLPLLVEAIWRSRQQTTSESKKGNRFFEQRRAEPKMPHNTQQDFFSQSK